MEDMERLPLLESDDSEDDVGENNFQDQGNNDLNFDCSQLKADEYVVVNFETKKKIIHYVGQIVEDGEDQMIKYLKREKPTAYNFVCANEELFDFLPEDIVCKLPNPTPHGGTTRVSRHLSFGVDLSIFTNIS